MTLVQTEDRITMADQEQDHDSDLDKIFECVERATPDGFRSEIVEGYVYMSPQREAHWRIIRRLVRALEDAHGLDVLVLSDVRIDFPGESNAFAPDVAKLRKDAEPVGGRWQYQDVEFVAEVISRGTGQNDYGPKKAAYASAEVPVYLVADPYQRRCHVYTEPRDGEYRAETIVEFGLDVDLSKTPAALVLATEDFPDQP
ncbi:Uma2 family endonuclease [Streptomyces sp. SID11385]|uniref:Uma2 family endonuclease n=1 Tax=Streptomyces sp. SID11385 TaxID=2706031 RepID=UPI0013CD908D|nr:Uma2 family endonuclease [Streptomyces sp. SID11385]NEA42632.1 Uma2 family endonuclease [Streptomyces sp. SID11385]